MDPWQPCLESNPISLCSEANTTDVVDLASLLHNENIQEQQDHTDDISDEPTNSNQSGSEKELSFGDNFQPFVKLPDSQEYLDSLERKLSNIQKGGRKGPNAESILRSLGQAKESCMLKLLSNSVEKLTTEGDIYEDLKVNPLLKKLAPEKQALSAEELVHLLKADQLEILIGGGIGNEGELPSTSATELNSTAGGSDELESSQETEKDRDSTENLASSIEPPAEQE